MVGPELAEVAERSGLPHPLTLASELSQSSCDALGAKRNLRTLVNLTLTTVQRIRRNVKTPGLKHLQLPDV